MGYLAPGVGPNFNYVKFEEKNIDCGKKQKSLNCFKRSLWNKITFQHTRELGGTVQTPDRVIPASYNTAHTKGEINK